MNVEVCGCYRENTETVAYQEQSLDPCFLIHTVIDKDVLSPGVMIFACNLGVAAICLSQRVLVIPES